MKLKEVNPALKAAVGCFFVASVAFVALLWSWTDHITDHLAGFETPAYEDLLESFDKLQDPMDRLQQIVWSSGIQELSFAHDVYGDSYPEIERSCAVHFEFIDGTELCVPAVSEGPFEEELK